MGRPRNGIVRSAPPPGGESPLLGRIREFLAHIGLGQNLSPRTVASYGSDLRQFEEFLRR